MWEIILSSSIIVTVFGGVISIVGIILTNNYSRNKERSEKRYMLAKDIYQRLISIYTKNLPSESKKDESLGDMVTNAVITVFNDCINKLHEINYSFLQIKFILRLDVVKKLEDMINEAEKKHKQLFFSAMGHQHNIEITSEKIKNDHDFELLDPEQYQAHIDIFVKQVQKIETYFMQIIENELRKLM